MASQQNEIDRKLQEHSKELTKGVTDNLGTRTQGQGFRYHSYNTLNATIWINLKFIQSLWSQERLWMRGFKQINIGKIFLIP